MATLPLKYDVRNGIRKWGGMGNFLDGDCTIAAFEHIRMVKATTGASSWQKLIYQAGFRPPHTPYALEVYTQYLATLGEKPPNAGVDPASFLTWAQEHKMITAWGSINIDKTFVDANGFGMRDRLHQAMINYRGVMLSVELTLNACNYYQKPQPWHIGTGPNDQPNAAFAHETALVAYTPDLDEVVTWGQMKAETPAFTLATVYDAHVFLDAQDTSLPNYAQLLANIKNL